MKYKKIIISLLIILFLFMLVICGHTKKIEFQIDNELTTSLKKKLEKNHGVDLRYFENNIIYGSIYDHSINTTILETRSIFTYDIKSKQFINYNYDMNNRIMDFKFLNDNIFYIQVEEKDKKFYWKFIMSNKSFSNKKTLKYGIVENPFSHPRILHDNNTIVLVSINDIDDEVQEYSIDLITPNNDIINIKNEKGYKNKKIGNLLYNISNVSLSNKKVLYTEVDDNKVQYLSEINVDTKENKVLLKNDKNMFIIYNFKKMKKGLYIQLALKEEENKSYFIYIKDNEIEKKIKGDLKTFDNVYKDYLIFHNKGNKFEIFSEEKLSFKHYNIDIVDIFPYYIIISDRILIQDFSNNFYFSESLEKYI